MIGAVVGPYRLVAELGSGGMGTVYRAEVVEPTAGLEPGTQVAVKIAHPQLLREPGFFKRILREGAIGQRIRHRNVVATLGLDAISVGSETIFYLAMEYVQGRTLRRLMDALGPAPEAICRHVAREVAAGLEAIHAQGVVHRDLKPENLMVSDDRVVKVMDLGLARAVRDASRLSAPGTFTGSMLYAAPEQFRQSLGALDGRADLFVLGIILYEMAMGTHPFHRDADGYGETVRRVLTEPPPPLSERDPRFSAAFDQVVRTLLAKERDARFPSARALIDALTEQEPPQAGDVRATKA